LLKYFVIDITLDQFEQDQSDLQLRSFCSLKAKEAVQKCRSQRRLDIKREDTVFVYRLPVILDWSRYPMALSRFRDELRDAAIAIDDCLQVVIWSSKFTHQLEIICNPVSGDLCEAVSLADIRQAEFSSFLNSNEILYEHAGSALFYLPSDQISDYFLRVGNLQSKHQYYSAVFFWTITHLNQVQHIFCDTWSISTTAAVLSEQLMTYRTEIDEGFNRVSWSFSPSYLPTSNIRSKLVFDAIHSAQRNGGKALFLSSFYSSGKLETAIADELHEYDARDVATLVAIFGIDGDLRYSEEVLCSISDFLKERDLKGKNVIDDRSKDILDVDKVSFFPDYRPVSVRPFLVSDIKKHSGFFENYCSKDIFSVHRDGRHSKHQAAGQPRHHAYHVDVERLFGEVQFGASLNSIFENVAPFDCLMHDGSNGAISLIAALRLHCPNLLSNAACFTVPDWRNLSGEEECLAAINTSGMRTLILVPTFITGRTLGDLKKHLRQTSLQSMKDMHCLIGLLRPADLETIRNYTEVGARYVGTGALNVVESLVLPNWGRKDCPWCIEQNTLDQNGVRAEFSSKTRALFKERHDQLQSGTENGLIGTEVFFLRDRDPTLRLPFYGGSLFKDALNKDDQQELDEIDGLERSKLLIELAENSKVSEADLCLVVANAIQNWRLRTQRTSVKRLTIDAATVSNDDKYNEARLRAGIWRALKAEELSLSVRASDDFSHMLARIFSDQKDANHRCLELEACLAFGSEISREYNSSPDNWNWDDVKFLCFPEIT